MLFEQSDKKPWKLLSPVFVLNVENKLQFYQMGQSQSKKNIEQEFQIHQVHENGDTLLKSKKDDKDYFMRIVTCTNQPDLDRLKALLQSRAQLKSRHLLSLVEIKQKKQDYVCSIHYKMYLVLQYSFKNAAQQIKDRSKGTQTLPFQQSDLWSILYSCCSALQALYSNGTTHECLTANQIFISTDGFVKISQPVLFGLEKNHLEAMRSKQLGKVEVHLSPEIMNCLEDQNFFYYDKEKSDIFILGMIIVDLSLLQNNILYDAVKKKANLQILPGLLKRVGERYSQNLTSIIAQMLRIQSKSRPSLAQIIQKVQKCNNIGQDFTLQTQSNLKSNDVQSQQGQERFMFQKPAKYKALEIREQLLLSGHIKPKQNDQKVLLRVEQQPSLSIKEQTTILNQQNFDGRVFATTPHQINYNLQGVNHADIQRVTIQPQQYIVHQHQQAYPSQHQQAYPSQHQQAYPIQHLQAYPIQVIQVPPATVTSVPANIVSANHVSGNQLQVNQLPVQNLQMQVQNPPMQPSQTQTLTVFQQKQQQINNNLQSFKKTFDLYERSKSIDSIKVTSNQYSTVSQGKDRAVFTATKVNPFNTIEGKNVQINAFKNKQLQYKKISQPIFTHEIPEVYNLMIKNSNKKIDYLANQQTSIIAKEKQHVSTPQFQGQIERLNRFSNLRNYQNEAMSRFGDESEASVFQPVQLRKHISHTQSQSNHVQKDNAQLQSFKNQCHTPTVYPSNITFNNIQNNSFAGSTPFPSSRPPLQGCLVDQNRQRNQNSPFNVGSSVSYTFSPSKIDFSPKKESFTCRSGFAHLSQFHNEHQDLKLQYVKQDIPQRGSYQGYKANGEKNGHGILYFKDGGHFQGEWKKDKMHGFGKLYYQNGTIAYQGHWENDQFNGQGRVYNMQPITFQEQFNYKDFSELGSKWVYYQGQFKNDSKHGKGYIKLTNGQMFEGLFDHDMIQGNGIFYKKTGQIVIGFWIDNKLFLNQSYQQDRK